MKYLLAASLLFSLGCGQKTIRPYYHMEYVTDGQVRVVCENGGDATVRPTEQFGSIIVDCGTR
jgi:hypothetical protein